MHVKKKKVTRYQFELNNEKLDDFNDEKEQKPEQKGAKIMCFDTYCKGIYYQNCYSEGLLTKD